VALGSDLELLSGKGQGMLPRHPAAVHPATAVGCLEKAGGRYDKATSVRMYGPGPKGITRRVSYGIGSFGGGGGGRFVPASPVLAPVEPLS
jgi:hypothetical protein